MKKLILISIFGITLAGCSTISDVNADDFLVAKSVKPASEIVGTWSGASGPYLNTIKINQDGTGLFCYSWNDKNSSGKLVFDGTYIIYQSGEKLNVDGFTINQINMSSNYYMGSKYKFYRDSDLSKASTYCQHFFENQ